MNDDSIDRTDELLELIAEEQRREHSARNSEPDDPYRDVPPPDEPPSDDHHTDDQAEDEATAWQKAVRNRAQQFRLDRDARALLDDETRPPIIYPPVTPLNELLDQPDEEVAYRIDRLAPKQGNIILAAQYKAGKTILGDNLIRSLVDGDPFLGRFEVHQQAEHLVLIDNELGKNTVRRWLREQNITNTKAVADVITLRGRVASFNILDDKIRDQWATRFGDLGCDYLMLDCLRPCLDALGLDENRDVGKFLVAFDALLADAGIADSFIAQHMGHANERSRGDSRLQDWPDALWRMMREDDNPNSPRYFTAYGRDVDVAEGRLGFDKSTRRLTFTPGSRRNAKAEAAQIDVVKLLACCADRGAPDFLSKSEIEDELSGPAYDHTQKAIRDGIKLAVKHGLVDISPTRGPHGAHMHCIANPCSKCGLPVTGGTELDCLPRHLSCPRPEEVVEGLFDE